MMQKFYGILMLWPLLLIGCGESGPPMYEVSGTVSFDGKPLEEGDLVLDPIDGLGQSASAKIVDGRFQLKAPPGKKRVDIRALKHTGRSDPYGEPEVIAIIPKKFNVNSELTAEVLESAANNLSLELSSR